MKALVAIVLLFALFGYWCAVALVTRWLAPSWSLGDATGMAFLILPGTLFANWVIGYFFWVLVGKITDAVKGADHAA